MKRCLPFPLLCAVLLLACGGNEKSAGTATPNAVPDAANAAYLIEGKTVTLSNGKADEPAAPGSASRNVTTLTASRATGDLDSDGKADLAVVLTNSPGGSGTFYYLAALSSSSTAPFRAVLLGDRVSISQVSIKSGTITVSYLARPDGAPFTATPSVPSSKVFSFTGGQLTQN
jgi:hypothetical protein